MKKCTSRLIVFCFALILLTYYMIVRRATKNGIINTGGQESVRVVIVDEHHTVLPYWYEESWRSGVEKFTLVHIDGHSDFGPFSYFKKAFNRPRNREEVTPYMQRNDVFILGAVAGGLIDRMVWVWPEGSSFTNLPLQGNHTHGYILLGWFDFQEDDLEQKITNRGVCFCAKELKTDGKDSNAFEDNGKNCLFAEPELIPYQGPKVKCHFQRQVELTNLRSLTYKRYLNKLNEKKTPIILDIDEDYYACEKGSDVFTNVGTNWTTIENINTILEEYTTPRTIQDETELNHTLTKLVTCSLATKCLNPMKNPRTIKQPTEFNDKLIKQFRTLSKPQIDVLNRVGFCLANSPITTDNALNRSSNYMMVCAGYNEPDSQNSDFYTTTPSEVRSEGRHLLELYEGNVKLVTISRSYRDGYVQKGLQPLIENDILDNLRRKMVVGGIHYDENLLAH